MTYVLPKEYYEKIAKKPIGADVVIFNEKGELLLLKPNYKNHWLLPGGTAEKNESPKSAAIREVKEEIGLDVNVGEMLCLDYITIDEIGDGFVTIFSSETLPENRIKDIKLQDDEILEYKFVVPEIALDMVSASMKKRLRHCLEIIKTGKAVYLENGE